MTAEDYHVTSLSIIRVDSRILTSLIFLVTLSAIMLLSTQMAYAISDTSQIDTTGNTDEQIKTPTQYDSQSDGPLSLSLNTDRITYVPGEFVRIYGFVHNTVKYHIPTMVSILVTTVPKNDTIYKTSVYSDITGYFHDDGLNIENQGVFKVTASILPDDTTQSLTMFNVKEVYFTNAAYISYIGVASFVGLMILIARQSKVRPTLRELLRFVFITIIAMVPLIAYVLTEVEIGVTAPLGLVMMDKKTPVPGTNETITSSDWVINVGGTASDGFKGGIQIPIYVFLFGLSGGYIRYLYTTFVEKKAGTKLGQEVTEKSKPLITSEKSENVEIYPENEKKKHEESSSLTLFYHSLEDLAFLLLSPLLAIATYFLLIQAGITALPTLAAVSFAVGLVTKQIVERLQTFAVGQVVPVKKDEEKKQQTNIF